jgi:hypothetical protein
MKFDSLTESEIIDIMTDLEKHDMRGDQGSNFNQDIQSKVIRAGKRTYFFDVKQTRGNEMYLIITESKKKFENDGNFSYEKHKIFLYQEDFENFSEAMKEMFEYIKANQVDRPDLDLPAKDDLNEFVDFSGLDMEGKS